MAAQAAAPPEPGGPATADPSSKAEKPTVVLVIGMPSSPPSPSLTPNLVFPSMPVGSTSKTHSATAACCPSHASAAAQMFQRGVYAAEQHMLQ